MYRHRPGRRDTTGRLPDVLPHEGEPRLWCFCPAWVGPLWRARDFKGAMTVWECLDIPYSKGMGRVIVELTNALVSAENEAQERWDREKA